jgi:hypothetical protein
LFETNIEAIAEIVHAKGGMIYLDGANLNALMGVAKPGHMGVDVLHMNLHKTFSTPHGGGGPGAGPVAVAHALSEFLPVPRIIKRDDRFELQEDFPKSVGRVRSFFGNFGILVRAYSYITALGGEGLEDASRMALLNANYIRKKLARNYQLAYNEPCMHECIFTDRLQQRSGVSTLDIAKRLLDYGHHPPTIYFPLVVSGALMIEPTETETPETLDDFVQAMLAIAAEAKEAPELVKEAPYSTPVRRLAPIKAKIRIRTVSSFTNASEYQTDSTCETVVEPVIVVLHRSGDEQRIRLDPGRNRREGRRSFYRPHGFFIQYLRSGRPNQPELFQLAVRADHELQRKPSLKSVAQGNLRIFPMGFDQLFDFGEVGDIHGIAGIEAYGHIGVRARR